MEFAEGFISRGIPKFEHISQSRIKRRKRGLWQRRFWAHLLTSQEVFNNHFDYIHWNPVKHCGEERVTDWPYSSFHRNVARGVYVND